MCVPSAFAPRYYVPKVMGAAEAHSAARARPAASQRSRNGCVAPGASATAATPRHLELRAFMAPLWHIPATRSNGLGWLQGMRQG